MARVMGEYARGSRSGKAITQAVKKSAIIFSIRVTMNSLIPNARRRIAAHPDHRAPPARAARTSAGISRPAGRCSTRPSTVAESAPITSWPGWPRLTAPLANAMEADNPVRTSGTEFLIVVASGESPKRENWNRAW